MESFTVYVVQAWHGEPYNYWADVIEPCERMFAIPVTSYETAEEAFTRIAALREQGNTSTLPLRVVRRTTAQEVITA